jgi:two-component system, NarL family, sensor kinase
MVELPAEKLLSLVFIVSGSIAALLLFLIIALVQFYVIKVRKQKELLATIVSTQENERIQIAREFHDNLGAMISLSISGLENLTHIDDAEKQKQSIRFLANNLNETRISLKDTIRNLAPGSHAGFNWIEELQRLALGIPQVQLKITIEVSGEPVIYSHLNQTNLFRIVQELINNGIKHSGAGYILISLVFLDDLLEISYEDNGKGFDSSNASAIEGFGMKSLEARTKTMCGRSAFQSSPGNGTRWNFRFSHKQLKDAN